MGKIDIEKTLNSVHFFTLGACQNSMTIRYNSCGGSVFVDAAKCDTTAIFKYTANTIATWENCFADSSSTNLALIFTKSKVMSSTSSINYV